VSIPSAGKPGRPSMPKKTICCIGPTVPDGMHSMLLDGFRRLSAERYNKAIKFLDDQNDPWFYRRAKRADLVLVFTNQGTKWRMIRDIAKVHDRWAVVDGSDYSDFSGIKTISPESAPLIFKREYHPDTHDAMPNVLPLSFSIKSNWVAGRSAKFLDYVFAGQMYGRRNAFLRVVESSIGSPHSVLSPGGLNGGQYWAMLDSAKIGISLRGAGWDCVRHWEILSRRGCLLMLEDDPKVRMSDPPLIDGVHCAMFRRPAELVEKLKYYLENDSERRRVAKAGRAFAFEHHSSAVRAKHVLRTCLNHFRTPQA